jgi:hypothetical protein
MHTTRFWNNLHRVLKGQKIGIANNLIVLEARKQKGLNRIANIYMIMGSCPGNMPKYYPGLRDILPDPNMSLRPV